MSKATEAKAAGGSGCICGDPECTAWYEDGTEGGQDAGGAAGAMDPAASRRARVACWGLSRLRGAHMRAVIERGAEPRTPDEVQEHVWRTKLTGNAGQAAHLREAHGRRHGAEWKARVPHGFGYEFEAWHLALHMDRYAEGVRAEGGATEVAEPAGLTARQRAILMTALREAFDTGAQDQPRLFDGSRIRDGEWEALHSAIRQGQGPFAPASAPVAAVPVASGWMAGATTEHYRFVAFGATEGEAREALVAGFVREVERTEGGAVAWSQLPGWGGERPTVAAFEDAYGISTWPVEPGRCRRDGEEV